MRVPRIRLIPALLPFGLLGWAGICHADSIEQACEGVVIVKQEDNSWVVLHDGATLVDKGEGNYQIWDVGEKSEYDSTRTRSELLEMYCRAGSV